MLLPACEDAELKFGQAKAGKYGGVGEWSDAIVDRQAGAECG